MSLASGLGVGPGSRFLARVDQWCAQKRSNLRITYRVLDDCEITLDLGGPDVDETESKCAVVG